MLARFRVLTLIVPALLAAPAAAQNTYTWNVGAGTWDTTTANWTGAATVWANPTSPPDVATFGGTGSAVTVASGINVGRINFNASGYTLSGGPLTLLAGGTITVPTINAATGTTTITAPLAGSAGFVKLGTGGSLTLGGSAANTNGGTTTVVGTLLLGKTGGAVAVAGNLDVGNGTASTGQAATDPTVTHLQSNQYGPTTVVTFSCTSASSSRFNLLNTNQTVAGVVDPNGAAVIQNGSYTTGSTANAVLTVNGAGASNVSGYVRNNDSGGTGTLGLTKAGTGTLTLCGGNISYSGPTTLTGGTLRLTNTPGFGSAVTLDAANAVTLELNAPALANAFDFSPVIAGGSAAAGVVKTGSGTVALTAATNAYAAPTTVAGGTLIARNASSLGSGAVTVQSGAALQFDSGTFTLPNAVSLAGTGVAGVANAGAVRVTAGRQTLGGPVTLTAATTVNTLQGGTSAAFVVSGAIGETAAGTPLTLVGGASSDSTVRAVTFSGAGANTYTGATQVSQGTLVLAKTGGAVAVPGNLTVGNGGAATGQVTSDPTVDHGQSNQYGPNTVVTFSSTSANSSRFNLLGTNQTVAGISDPNGAAVIQNGSYFVGAPGNAVLTVNGAGASTISGYLRNNDAPAAPTLGLTKAGTGTLTLSGGNISHSGPTLVQGGTLLWNATSGTAGTVTVGAGATLGGNGSTGKAVSLDADATLAPGGTTLAPGILTVANAVTFAAGATFGVELNGATAGTGYDRLTASGTVTLGNATLSPALGYTPAAGDKLFIIDNTGAAAVGGTFAGLPQGGTVTFGNGTTATISYVGNTSSLALTGGNDVVLYNFAPVPEPATVVAVAMAVLTGGGVGRRLLRRRGA